MKLPELTSIPYGLMCELRENGGKCPYCRQKPVGNRWFGGSANSGGACLDFSPCCAACADHFEQTGNYPRPKTRSRK